MIEQLFGSKTRVKLLHLFYGNPNRSFYVREITRKIDEQINSVRRELANLLSIGIISSDNTDNKLFYEVNQSYEYYEPLSAIFGVAGVRKQKSKPSSASAPDVMDQEQEVLALGNVDLAVLTGQFTRDETSGTDVLIVGDVNPTKINKFISDLEQREGKELRYTVMSPSDYAYRLEVNDRFLANVMSSKRQTVVDKYAEAKQQATKKEGK